MEPWVAAASSSAAMWKVGSGVQRQHAFLSAQPTASAIQHPSTANRSKALPHSLQLSNADPPASAAERSSFVSPARISQIRLRGLSALTLRHASCHAGVSLRWLLQARNTVPS